MSKDILPKYEGIFDIINSGSVIHIPFYQRKYVWKNEVKIFLEDIEHLLDTTYFGQIVFRENTTPGASGERILNVIDGQQRITTSILILKVLYKKFCDLGINTDLNQAMENIKEKFKNISYEFDTFKKILNDEEIEKNNNEIYCAWLTINEFFKNKTKQQLEQFQENFRNNVKIVTLTCKYYSNKDELTIFADINSKGKPLSIGQLFKNWCFKNCIHDILENNDKVLQELWSKYCKGLDGENSDGFFESLYYYKTPNEFSTEEKSRMLLKEISKLFNTTNEELDIDGFTKMLVRISNLKTIYDQIKDNSIYNRITDITRKISPSKKNLFYPILYYFYENAVANEEQKEIIVKCCFWAACEYIHGGQGDSQTKRTFFERIHKYFATKNFSEIYKINIDISIDSFKNYAKDDWAIKFILWCIDIFPNGFYADDTNWTFNDKNITVEHIMPQSLSDSVIWKEKLSKNSKLSSEDIKSGYDKYKNKIGNFLLLTQKINSTVGNKYITDKQKEYENYCKGLKTYMNNDERIDVSRKNSWNFEDIERRTDALSSLIMKIIENINN